MKNFGYNDYNKRITTHDNSNVQSHDQEKSYLNTTINPKIDAQKNPFNKNKLATIKSNKILTKNL